VTAGWTVQGERWRLLAPDGAVVVHLKPGPLGVRRAGARLRSLAPGTPVVLLDGRPGGKIRARRAAATGAVAVDRQYVALPSLSRAIVMAEDCPAALRWAFRSVVAPPPGTTWAHALVDAAVRFLRRRPAVAGWLAFGRIVVGRRG